jgi:hypothetical protein
MFNRSFVAGLVVLIAFTCGLAVRITEAAEAIVPSALAGWWLAIDQVEPQLWAANLWPVEELLVIDASGTAETRFMTFVPVNVTGCLHLNACSDAPVVQRSTLEIAGDLIAFDAPVPVEGGNRRIMDPRRQATSVTSAPVWRASLSGGGAMLLLDQVEGALPRRIFAHVDPIRLGRLRAGFLRTEAGVVQSWRCYLAHATVGDPAFLPIFRGEHPQPAWLDAYLTAASYGQTLMLAVSIPPPDYPDPRAAAWSKAPLDPILAENFPDLATAKTMAEYEILELKAAYLSARLFDRLSDADARAKIADKAKGRPVNLAISREALARLAGAKTDPELKAMTTCR